MNKNFKVELVKKINSSNKKYRLIRAKYGYYHISPTPTASELSKLYEKEYFKDLSVVSSKGMDIGGLKEIERFHFDRQYEEILSFIKRNFKQKNIKILDVGCGTGMLLKYLYKKGIKGLSGTEIDPSQSTDKIPIFNGDFLNFKTQERFDFILFNNILEHVINPQEFLKKARNILKDSGYIRVQVPNDLSYTQHKAVSSLGKGKFYFFCPPEHINYFDFASMEKMLRANHFNVVEKTTNWPMDIFILMGIDYPKDPKLGKLCHGYRMNFEYNTGKEFLTTFYQEIAKQGIGRVVIQYAKKI
ncbi:MAG: class I SAM-dependent methyltransferase [bacterium]|nr:class I SAM-dependent methyltransferase [bacterium]